MKNDKFARIVDYSLCFLNANFDDDIQEDLDLSQDELIEAIPKINKLFAAAPELLSALHELIAEADSTGGNTRKVTRYSVDKARAAITKATGGEA